MSAQMCLPGCCVTDNREDGRFFAALRMTCFAMTIGEICLPGIGTNCHPEEAARPTKDLLRHWLIPKRLALIPTQQPARLRLHGHAEEARVSMGSRNTGISTSSMTTS